MAQVKEAKTRPSEVVEEDKDAETRRRRLQ